MAKSFHGKTVPLHIANEKKLANLCFANYCRLPRFAQSPYLLSDLRNEEVWTTLLNEGVDVNAKILYDGATPCHRALFRTKVEYCLDLLKAGADPSIQNAKGQDVADYIESRLATLWSVRAPRDHFDPLVIWLRENYREIRIP